MALLTEVAVVLGYSCDSMNDNPLAAFDRTANDLTRALTPDAPLFPELEAARQDPGALHNDPHVHHLLWQIKPVLESIRNIPQTTYTDFHAFALTGDRAPYETAYFHKRQYLYTAALGLFFGQMNLRDLVHDYLWSICEETTWVLPAHQRVIDIMAAETAFGLAEVIYLVGADLDADVRRRVHNEIERRIFVPFLHGYFDLRWFNGDDNWNGVCSGAIGGAFLYLERDPERLAQALALVLESLKTYFSSAFEKDGGSTEGAGYWQYGLTYPVVFAEMLRARSGGGIDLLADPRVRQIAAFPGHVLLPGGTVASFADCGASLPFHPGIISRLATRTGEPSLWQVLAPRNSLATERSGPRALLPHTLRDLLWWDGQRPDPTPLEDSVLPATGVARMMGMTADGAPIAVAVKAGHNDEHHNHNDIGSFVLNVDGEALVTDPGYGPVNRDYFGAGRYESVFANSYGHSVPRIDGAMQGAGRTFTGAFLGITQDPATGYKRATVELTHAYPVPALQQAMRQLIVGSGAEAGAIWLHDRFAFNTEGRDIEEALITRLPVDVDGATAILRGEQYVLSVTIEQPAAHFSLEFLADDDRASDADERLMRLSFVVPAGATIEARVRMEIVPITRMGHPRPSHEISVAPRVERG
jgi:hypothetical protein